MVDDYGCGFAFDKNDYKDLSKHLENLIADKALYLKISNNAFDAASKISPSVKAMEIVNQIKLNFTEAWY